MAKTKATKKRGRPPKAASEAEQQALLAQEVLRASDDNIRAKVAAGKTLTGAERQRLEEITLQGQTSVAETGLGFTQDGKTYYKKKGHLAAAIGITYRTLGVRFAKGLYPEYTYGLGWCLEDCQKAEAMIKGGTRGKGRPTNGESAKGGGGGGGVSHIDADSSDILRGAEYALDRINEDEAQCFANYTEAKAQGDPPTIKFYRALWREAASDQRAQEKAIEEDRRATGDLLPQQQAVDLMYHIGLATLRAKDIAIKRCAGEVVGMTDIRKIAQTLYETLAASMVNSVDMAVRKGSLPEWATDSLKDGLMISDPK